MSRLLSGTDEHMEGMGMSERIDEIDLDDERSIALLDRLGPLPWYVWNRLPQPDGMTIYDPDGFRGDKPRDTTYTDFLTARMECTLVDRREWLDAGTVNFPAAARTTHE